MITEFLYYERKRLYVEHYERREMELDNLCAGTKDVDCYM